MKIKRVISADVTYICCSTIMFRKVDFDSDYKYNILYKFQDHVPDIYAFIKISLLQTFDE